MNKSLVPTVLAVATAAGLALTSPAEAGGGRYFGGGGHGHVIATHGSGGHWGGGHGSWRGGYWGPYWGVHGWGWGAAAVGATIALAATWPYWTGAYYYDSPSATYVYPRPAVVYRNATVIEPAPDAYPAAPSSPSSSPMFRLFCPASNAYYPDVLDCAPYFVKVNPDADRAKSAPPAVAPDTAVPAPAPRSSAPSSYAPAARSVAPDAHAGLATQAAYRNSASAQVAAIGTTSRVIPAPKKLGPGIALAREPESVASEETRRDAESRL